MTETNIPAACSLRDGKRKQATNFLSFSDGPLVPAAVAQFDCKACGHRGADVRPDFSAAKKRPGARCEFSKTRVGP
jgi:hypothetical protein